MIDIWMIATLMFPFTQVILHTYKEMLRAKILTQVSPIVSTQGVNAENMQLKYCHYLYDWILPIVSVLFATIYWLLGISLYLLSFSVQEDITDCI